MRLQRRLLRVIVAVLSMLGGRLEGLGGVWWGGGLFGFDGRLWLHKIVGGAEGRGRATELWDRTQSEVKNACAGRLLASGDVVVRGAIFTKF